MDIADKIGVLEGLAQHSQRLARIRKLRQRERERESEAKRQKVGEIEGKTEEGTSSGMKYALLAMKRKATISDTRSAEGPLRRCYLLVCYLLTSLTSYVLLKLDYLHIGHTY